VVLVGDRGMLTRTQIDMLRKHPGLGWVSALGRNPPPAHLDFVCWQGVVTVGGGK
jgi:hypothetical protein